MKQITVRVTPLSDSEREELVRRSGGFEFSRALITCRDSLGMLVQIDPKDVVSN
jgi:hypothetical protein